jgi:hypothetical protein
MNTNIKAHKILTPQYWKWYLNNKQNCKTYHRLIQEGVLKNRDNSVFEDEMSVWTEHLINNVVPEKIEINLKAGKKRLGMPLPLQHEQKRKYRK